LFYQANDDNDEKNLNWIQVDRAIENWTDKYSGPLPAVGRDGWMKHHYVFKSIQVSKNFNQLCPRGIHEFGSGDGGKFYCDTGFTNEKDCIVFSIGSNGDYSFERDVVKKSSHCIIHTFDCTGNYIPPSDLQNRVHFHQICIGDKEDTEKLNNFKTYAEMLQLTISGGNYTPKYFKMDIEVFFPFLFLFLFLFCFVLFEICLQTTIYFGKVNIVEQYVLGK
jgi:hypothetical protein